MKNCEKCGHEYLDSYAECPFCERETATDLPHMSEAEQTGRSRASTFIWIAVAVLVIAACAAGLALFASTSSDEKASESPPKVSAQEQCFIIQQDVEQAAVLREVRLGEITDESADLVPEYLTSVLPCPEQGVYTLVWNARLPRYECSVHGWHGDQ